MTYEQMMQRARGIGNWTDNIHSSAPARYRPNVKVGAGDGGGDRKTIFFPTTSGFSKINDTGKGSPVLGAWLGALYGSGRAGIEGIVPLATHHQPSSCHLNGD
ncbi:hypothetical protein FRB94_005279 [Tulasnella sp. JGI-2019a]|nr:hypothetical protein FRB94_005279 [Tulasnella sp. JGI-2019a]KAG9016185.1 hypothetical protein FRB93_011659 [Tulasnella sp. JGI-2019a]KAG9036503.1 hypothetical protein FRB95_008801 [Tulasnella sp. JGI-2019a]